MNLIRAYQPSDFSCLAKWIDCENIHTYWCANSLAYPLCEAEFNHIFAEYPTRLPMVMIDSDAQPVGFFIYQSVSEQNALLRYIVVDHCQRGKGYGVRLVKFATQYAFNNDGKRSLELDVFKENSKAIGCYLKAGFEILRDNDLRLDGILWPRYRMVMYKK